MAGRGEGEYGGGLVKILEIVNNRVEELVGG